VKAGIKQVLYVKSGIEQVLPCEMQGYNRCWCVKAGIEQALVCEGWVRTGAGA
jgi:hypothetical protein